MEEKQRKELIKKIIEEQDIVALYTYDGFNKSLGIMQEYSKGILYSGLKKFILQNSEMLKKFTTKNLYTLLASTYDESEKQMINEQIAERLKKEEFFCEDIDSEVFLHPIHTYDSYGKIDKDVRNKINIELEKQLKELGKEYEIIDKNQLVAGLKEVTALFEEADGLWINLQGKDRKEKLEKNNINLNNELVNEHIQKNFLETNLGKAINTAVDIGIRAIFPDFFEDQIIDIKDNLLNYGLKDGIRQTIDDAIDMGRSAIGIVTGNFESINQMQNAVKNGGIIDGISSLLDTVIDKVKKAGLINNTIAKTIKQGKNIILNNVENNITSTFNKQYESIDYANKYISNWKENFEKKDFSGMEKEYKKIEKQLNNIAPIEKTINEAKTIMTLHNLIKNNGQNFNLSKEQLELAEKLK